jgi:4,5-dihydroxyphthalate decarboxylase
MTAPDIRRGYLPATGADGNVRLRTALGRGGVREAVLDGLTTPGWSLDLHDIQPLPRAFRMMVNDRSFHVAEMALTTLAMAIDHGRPIIGVPAVLSRDFHYRSILVRTGSGVTHPSDLVGKRVGVRAYSQTTGVWVRGLLHTEYGVAPDQVTWLTFESSHVAEYVDPPQVERATEGRTLIGMLTAGELDAAVIMDPDVDPEVARPLFPAHRALARRAFETTGIFPVNHVLAIDTGTIDELPGIAAQLYALFVESKDIYAHRLRDLGPSSTQDHHALELADIVGGDFNPFGVEENRRSYEQLLQHAHTQGLLRRRIEVDDLFHPSVR